MLTTLYAFSISLVIILIVFPCAPGTPHNQLPIIGILSQEADSVKEYFPNTNYTSFISASYVKFVEAAGARVVAIWINRDEVYYRNIVQNTNGLLLPGGSVSFKSKNGYSDAAKYLYKIASEENKAGDHYPIIGICLGMEFLAVADAPEENNLLEHCFAQNIALPLNFKKDFRSTKLFHNADKRTIASLRNKSLTYHNHEFCVTPTTFDLFNLTQNWDIVTTSVDRNGLEFISVMENKHYPFYGLQFHPEKNIFDHRLDSNVPHTEEAIKVSQYITNFFVLESRKNGHKFPTWEEQYHSLIYQYQPIFINRINSSYEQLYMFK